MDACMAGWLAGYVAGWYGPTYEWFITLELWADCLFQVWVHNAKWLIWQKLGSLSQKCPILYNLTSVGQMKPFYVVLVYHAVPVLLRSHCFTLSALLQSVQQANCFMYCDFLQSQNSIRGGTLRWKKYFLNYRKLAIVINRINRVK